MGIFFCLGVLDSLYIKLNIGATLHTFSPREGCAGRWAEWRQATRAHLSLQPSVRIHLEHWLQKLQVNIFPLEHFRQNWDAMWQWPILRKVCWKTSRFSLYLSDLLPAHLPGRWQDDRGELVWKVGAVRLPGGQRISRACYPQRAHNEGTLRINICGAAPSVEHPGNPTSPPHWSICFGSTSTSACHPRALLCRWFCRVI